MVKRDTVVPVELSQTEILTTTQTIFLFRTDFIRARAPSFLPNISWSGMRPGGHKPLRTVCVVFSKFTSIRKNEYTEASICSQD